MTNIKLKRRPTRQERDTVDLLSQQPCDCTQQMKEGLLKSDPVCDSCGARTILNDIVTLAELVKK